MHEDTQLLRQFVADRSEDSFGRLVQLHINLVYGTALRLTQGNAAAAKDVTQIVFTDLASKAPRLPGDVLIGGWLYRHTYYTALKLLRSERRRIAREQEAVALHALNTKEPHEDAARAQLAPLVEETMASLNDQDRNALVLRFFEGRDFQAVGLALGSSEAAAQKRVSRALDKLRLILERRGISTTSAALATTLAGLVFTAAPAGLAAHITALACAGGAASGGAVGFFLMNLNKAKLAAGALALAGMSTILVIEHQANTRLRLENQQLREASAQLDGLRQENARLASIEADAAELARLRQEQKELLKLRGEVSQLRQQAAQASTVNAKLPISEPVAQEPTSPIVTFATKLSADIPTGQTLLAGGWKAQDGKRTLIFFTPSLVNETSSEGPQQVVVQSVIFQVPDEVLGQLGLSQMKAETSDSNHQMLLPNAQQAALLEQLKQIEGASIVSRPRVHTAYDVPASIAVGQEQVVAGEKVMLGSKLEIAPSAAADGSGIHLSIDAKLNHLRDQPTTE